MISSNTFEEAKDLAAKTIYNSLARMGNKINTSLLDDNELQIHAFNEKRELMFETSVPILKTSTFMLKNDAGEKIFVTKIPTENGDIIVSDKGNIVHEKIDHENEVGTFIISSANVNSVNIEKKPIVITDSISTIYGFSSVDDGGATAGFFSADESQNRLAVLESVQQMRKEGESIAIDEGQTLKNLVVDSNDHAEKDFTVKQEIIFFNFNAHCDQPAPETGDEQDDVLIHFDAANRCDAEFNNLLHVKAINNGQPNKVEGLQRLQRVLQRSSVGLKKAQLDLEVERSDVVLENIEAQSPSVEHNADMEEKSRNSMKEQTQSIKRRR